MLEYEEVDVPVGVFVCRLWSFGGVFFLLVACRVLEVIIFIVVYMMATH